MDKNANQREYRKTNNNACTKKYEKTKKGFLVRLYRNMLSRVTGVQKLKSHLYRGKTILPREDFYLWAIHSNQFNELFSAWERSNYDRRLTPSVDRVDPSIGYEPDNIEWVPFHINCSRGTISRNKIYGNPSCNSSEGT